MIDNTAQLLASAQTITDAWADLGDWNNVMDVSSIALWLKVDINNAINVRVRAVAKKSLVDTEVYCLPIATVSATVVKLDPEYFELNQDIDQAVVIGSDVLDLVPFVKYQVMAEVAGVVPGVITSAYLTARSGL